MDVARIKTDELTLGGIGLLLQVSTAIFVFFPTPVRLMDFELDQASFSTQVGTQVEYQLALLFASATTYGTHIILSIAAIVALCSRGLRPSTSKILLAAISMILVLNTCNWATTFTKLFLFVRDTLSTNVDRSFSERLLLARTRTIPLVYPTIWFGPDQPGLLFLVGDCIVLWRLWVLWRGSRLLLVIPFLLLFATTAVSIAGTTLMTLLHNGNIPMNMESITNALHAFDVLETTAASTNLAVNLFATALIGYQAHAYRMFVKTNVGGRNSPAGMIMSYLAESGAALCVIQIISFALHLSDKADLGASSYANLAAAHIFLLVSSSYPSMIVLLVHFNKSLENDVQIQDDGNQHHPVAVERDIGTHISFANGRSTGIFETTVSSTAPGGGGVNGARSISIQDGSSSQDGLADKNAA
ncbi:hypothetical protein BDV98DRAFT_595477 [Pterulicium gracile]|uniref:Uncharacterized protein n=1 Tax=Pterulicium gracile TaxID=1884261 RepID=A0A5C3QCE2_9AGAR|nr:hypothetical protein BDV98DRAFT_595477 [Pterula gracilis]